MQRRAERAIDHEWMLAIARTGAQETAALDIWLVFWYGPCVPCDMYRDRLLWLLCRVVVWVLDSGGAGAGHISSAHPPGQTLDLMTTTQWAIAASTTSDRSLAGRPGTSIIFTQVRKQRRICALRHKRKRSVGDPSDSGKSALDERPSRYEAPA